MWEITQPSYYCINVTVLRRALQSFSVVLFNTKGHLRDSQSLNGKIQCKQHSKQCKVKRPCDKKQETDSWKLRRWSITYIWKNFRGEPERVEPDEEDEEEPKASKKPIVEMEAVGFSRPSGMEAASMVKSAQKVNGSNESKGLSASPVLQWSW